MSRIELAPELADDFDRIFDHPTQYEVEDLPSRIREIIGRHHPAIACYPRAVRMAARRASSS